METWASVGYVMGFLAVLPSFVQNFLPPEFQVHLERIAHSITQFFSNYIYVTVPEYDGANINELFSAAQLHLSDSAATSASKVNLALPKNASKPTYSIAEHQRMEDVYKGVKVWWDFNSQVRTQQIFNWPPRPDEKRSFTLCIHKKERKRILNSYIDHVLERARELKRKRRDRLLYTNTKGSDGYDREKMWDSVPFKHPSTFDTLAMNPDQKQEIMEDLKAFENAEEFYKKAGRAWKRGYLLYGPPGTGKSSMIAAIANFLEYDVYDLELTEVKSNGDLRKLLIKTSNKSIIVIEDIDCSLDFSDRNKKQPTKKKTEEQPPSRTPEDEENQKSQVTLSGILNFTDGLWSCCGSERIIIFTTNHVEKLDPALLRSGRMDMHIHMSYCTFPAMRVLARNYLGVEEHELFSEAEAEMEGTKMTPADVSEVLIRNKKDPKVALERLVQALRDAKLKEAAMKEEKVKEGVEEEEKREVVMVKESEASSEKVNKKEEANCEEKNLK